MAKIFDLPDFSFDLAMAIITRIQAKLELSQEDSVILWNHLQTVIIPMAKHVIKPALLDAIRSHHPEPTDYTNIMATMGGLIHNHSIDLFSERLADAILPDLQTPGLLADKAAFKATLHDINEGLRAASKEEILASMKHAIQKIANLPNLKSSTVQNIENNTRQHSPRLASYRHSSHFSYIFDTLSSVSQAPDRLVLTLDPSRLHPGDVRPNGDLTAFFIYQAKDVMQQFVGMPPFCDISEKPSLSLGFKSVSDDTMRDACEAINKALQQYQAIKKPFGRGR